MVWHWEEELPKRLALKASEFRLREERGTPLLEGAHSVHQDQGTSAVSVESEPDLPAGGGGCPVDAGGQLRLPVGTLARVVVVLSSTS